MQAGSMTDDVHHLLEGSNSVDSMSRFQGRGDESLLSMHHHINRDTPDSDGIGAAKPRHTVSQDDSVERLARKSKESADQLVYSQRTKKDKSHFSKVAHQQ